MLNPKLLPFLAVVLLFGSPSDAQVRLPSVIGNHMVLQQSSSVNFWGWASPAEQIAITPSWDNKPIAVTATNNATWQVSLQTPPAGGPYSITIQASNKIILEDVLIGEVWICSGQSNMEWSYNHGLKKMKEEFSTCNSYPLRLFNSPKATAPHPQEMGEGRWSLCDSSALKAFSAVAYSFGKRLTTELKVPIGLIHASWGGTPAEVWTPEEVIRKDTALSSAAALLKPYKWWPNQPGYAYNAMIAPLTSYAIAGAIWYQGESNTETSRTYDRLMRAMIDSWRQAWKKDLPFYYVQIAPFQYGAKHIGALLREAQTQTLQHPNVGMVVIPDLTDDINDIHPQNKQEVGIRLANWALAETYERKGLAYKSPMMKNVTVQKNKMVIDFVNADNGLVIKGQKATEVFIAGASKIFYPAEVVLKGNQLIVHSKQVPEPVAVRYSFSNTAIGNLFSREGLPVAPFRTDNWDVETVPPAPAKE